MRFATVATAHKPVLAVYHGSELIDLSLADPSLPTTLQALLEAGSGLYPRISRAMANAPAAARLDPDAVTFLPPLTNPGKIICLGLNYTDHANESGFAEKAPYPVIFTRFASSLVGHGQPLMRPVVSEQFDYEGELVAVIGKAGRHISLEDALDHVAGYSIFNDASVRDYQFKSHQWTVGKNFDGTGGFGPAFVTADELPAGAAGLTIETRLNGRVLQHANTTDMIFGVAETVSLMSAAFALLPGDMLVMGTPSGVGLARKPPLYMQAGDVCEVEIEGVGILSNPVVNEVAEPVLLAMA